MKRTEVGRSSIPKDLKPLYKLALDAGWRVFAGGNNHLLWCAPDGARVSTSLTPSGLAAKKVRADLRRAGLAV